MRSKSSVLLSIVLCVCLATAGSGAGAQAEMLNVDRAEIRARLAAQGVDAMEAEARLAVLTDEEVSVLASSLEELPAGGSDPRGLFALVAFAAVVYVVIKLLPLILIGGGTVAAIKATKS
jgi:hypothetical protein